jgi:hypothetical protein
MGPQTDPVSKIESRIARLRERIARWEKEAGEIETLWTGGPAYRKFCEGMAGAAREKQAELEKEGKRLQAYGHQAPRVGEAANA